MKIGILTVPFNNNYGGYLQCYALMKTLRNLGHEPVVINRRQNIELQVVNRIKAFVANKLLGDKSRMYNVKTMEAYYAMKGINMYPFVKKYLTPMTLPLYNSSNYRDLDYLKLDAVIVGSDQVWRPQYVPNIKEYFLKFFPPNVRRIAYAASFGSDKLEYNERDLKECSLLLDSFYAVSTRESSGQKILSEYMGRVQSKVVLDPTMLLNVEYYQEVMGIQPLQKDKYVFAYILDRTQWKENFVHKISSYCSYMEFDIMKIDKLAPLYSIETWLKGIYSSDFVVTDSFHGTVFCILFNRPFYVIGNEKRGNSRMLDLLYMFGLENRLLYDGAKCIDEFNLDINIDWKYVNERLTLLRKESIEFLKQNLI